MSNGWCGLLRLGGIGDNLIASSVLPGLKKRFEHVEVISKEPHHVIFQNNPFVDKLSVVPEDDAPTDAVVYQNQLTKRARDFDAFFNLSNTCELALAFLHGQHAFNWPAKFRRQIADYSYLAFVHDLCDVPHDFAPMFYPTDVEKTQAWDTLNKIRSIRPGPVIGWCLAGSRIDKLYPYSAFAIGRLIMELGATVILFGSPSIKEKEMAKTIQEQVKLQNGSDRGLFSAFAHDPEDEKRRKGFMERPGSVASGPGEWPIRRILTQIQMCDLVVSPDTGPAWAVAMLDLPKIVLLSHASQKNITHGWVNTETLHADPGRVKCWPCHQLHETFDTCNKAPDLEAPACMADISVDRIVMSVTAGLSRIGPPPKPTGAEAGAILNSEDDNRPIRIMRRAADGPDHHSLARKRQ